MYVKLSRLVIRRHAMARIVWAVIWFVVLGFVAFLSIGAVGMAIGGDPGQTGTIAADAILSLGIVGVLLYVLSAIAVPLLLIFASLRLGRWTAHFFRA
jgi:hypothetical protein